MNLRFNSFLADPVRDPSGAWQVEVSLTEGTEPPHREFLVLKGLPQAPTHHQLVDAVQAFILGHGARAAHAARELALRESPAYAVAQVIPFRPPFWTRVRNSLRLFFSRWRRG